MLFVDGGNNRVKIGTSSDYGAGVLNIDGDVYFANSSNKVIQGLTPTGFGYSPTSYGVIQLGGPNTGGTVSIGYDPSGNTSGSFTGNGIEMLFPGDIEFYQPNATDTAWVRQIRMVNTAGVIINDAGQSDVDFRVESDGYAHMLFVDSGANHVNIGTATDLGGVLNIDGNASISGNAGAARYVALLGETSTYTGSLNLQAGGGSAGFGGSIIMYGHSHASKGGDVVLGISAGSGGKFRVHAGGTDTGTDRLTISEAGAFKTFPVVGQGAIFNEDGVDSDFRVESDNMTHALFVDGTTGKVGVFNSTTRSTLEVGVIAARHGIQLNGGPNGVATQVHMVDGKAGTYTTLTIDVQLGGAGGYMYQVQAAGTTGCSFQTGGGYTNGTINFGHTLATGSGFTVTSPSNNLVRFVCTSIGTHPVCEIRMTQALSTFDQDDVTFTWS
jgi:hypothetical protein